MCTCGIGQPEPTAQDCSHECHWIPTNALLWSVPVSYFLRHGWSRSLQTHIALMWDIKLNKILLSMTDTASIIFMAGSFFSVYESSAGFGNYIRALKWAVSCSQMEDVFFVRWESMSRWILKGRLRVEIAFLLQHRLGGFKPSQTVPNQDLDIFRVCTLKRAWGAYRIHKAFPWEGRQLEEDAPTEWYWNESRDWPKGFPVRLLSE